MTPISDFKSSPLFDVEYLRSDVRWTNCYYRPLIESDMWPIELSHCQRPWVAFEGHSRYHKGFIVCISKIQYVRSHLQRSDVNASTVQLFLPSYSTGRIVAWC